MKKVFLLLVSLSLVFSVAGSFAYAEKYSVNEVLFEAEEITDINILFKRAQNGITDIDEDNITNQKVSFLNGTEEFNPVVEYLATTQKIKSVRQDGITIDTFKTTSFTLITGAEVSGESKLIRPMGEVSDNDWDSAGGIKAYSTFTYNKRTENKLTVYKLVSVSGGWELHDSRYKLSDRKVVYGASGTSFSGGANLTQVSSDLFPSGNTFSYNAPTSWQEVAQSGMIMGVNTYISITRGTSSSWSLHHQNIFNTF
jgi:hypothetical protein